MEKPSLLLLPLRISWEKAWQEASFDEVREFIKSALKLLKEKNSNQYPDSWRHAVKQAIGEGVRVNGFMVGHAWKAPPTKILQAIKRRRLAPRYGGVLLKIGALVWAVEHQDLAHRVRAWLNERGYLWTTSTLDDKSPFAVEWGVARSLYEFVMSELKQDFAGESETDLSRAVWSLWRHATIPDEQLAEMFQAQALPESLRGVLGHVMEIPPDSEAWDEPWQDFLRYLEAAAVSKRLARGIEKEREQLRQALEALALWQEIYQDMPLARWRVETLPRKRIAPTLALAQQLVQVLKVHEELKAQPPSKVTELQAWSQRLQESATEIQNLIQQLEQVFSGPDIGLEEAGQGQQVEEEKEGKVEAQIDIDSESGAEPGPKEVSSAGPVAIKVEEDNERATVAGGAEEREQEEGVAEEPAEEQAAEPLAKTEQQVDERKIDEEKVAFAQGKAVAPAQRAPQDVEVETGGDAKEGTRASLTEISKRQGEESEDGVVAKSPLEPIPGERGETRQAREKLLAAVMDGDVGLAYWIAWAQEALEQRPVFSSHILAGLQMAHWLAEKWPHQDTLLLEELARWRSKTSGEADDEGKRFWGPWIALVAILSGDTNPWPWLDWIPNSDKTWRNVAPSLAEVWMAIRTPIEVGGILDLRHVLGHDEDYHMLAQQWSKRAREWLESAPHRTFSYQRASWLWQAMVRKIDDEAKGATYSIYRWLNPIARDERSRKNEVIKWVKEWQEDLEGKLDAANRWEAERRGKAPKRIEGTARAALLKRVREALELATSWLRAVELHEQEQRGHKGTQQRYRQLRQAIQQAIEQAPKEIRAYLDNAGRAQTPDKRVALDHLANWLERLQSQGERENDKEVPGTWHRLTLPKEMTVSRLSLALGSRLFVRTAKVSFAPAEHAGLRYWQPESPEATLRWCIDESVVTTLWADEQTVEQWARERYNFQLALIASELLPKDRKEEVQQRLEEWWLSTLESLHKGVAELIPEIEAAARDAILTENDYRALNAELVRLDEVLQTYRKSQFSLKSVDNLQPIRQGLDGVRQRLDEFTRRRFQDFRIREEQLTFQVRARWGHTSPMVEQAKKHIKRLKEKRDWRGLTEYFQRIEDALQKSQPDLLDLEEKRLPSTDALERFSRYEQIIYGKLSGAYQEGYKKRIWREISGSLPQDWFTTVNLPGPRKAQTNHAAQAWLKLKQRESIEIIKHWQALLEFLGFQIASPQRDITPDTTIRHQNVKRWKVRITPPLTGGTAEDNWIPPKWGSLAKGEYLVVGLWDRPEPRQVLPVLQDGARNSQILFYFGALGRRQRLEWGKALRRERIPALLIDEVLFWFLVGYPNALPTLFYCALPFTYINPYYPTGAVAEEMFFGTERRSALLSALLDGGIGVLYGGRQLGKTALLKRAQETFHHPSNKQAAFYIDLKKVGNETNPQRGLWQSLRGKFSLGVGGEKWLPRATKDESKILQVLEEKVRSGWLVRLFLDEADDLLHQESAHGFPVLHQFRDLEMLKRGGFKVVLAGLHNVQRYTRLPNHPLAQLGDVRVVGPLSYRDAEQLLTIPLAGLGIEIGNRETLRILSYTNRHPGLIQLFAREIIETLNAEIISGRRPLQFPIRVDQDLVEQIYSNTQVKDEIRKRFQWTIDLDARYRAIALYMAMAALDDPKAFEHWYRPKEIAQTLNYWLAWEKTLPPSLMEVTDILSEMEGLGILVSNDEKAYRLRSPNLIPLLGEQREIEDEFLKISVTDPSLQENSRRLKVGDGYFAPLDERERRLIFQHPVTLIVGSPDTGIKEVKSTLRHFVKLAGQQWAFDTFVPPNKRVKHLERQVKHPRSPKRGEGAHPRLMMIEIPYFLEPEDIHIWLTEAMRLAQRPEMRWQRLVFVMEQGMALEWLRWLYTTGQAAVRDQMESQMNVLHLQKWNQAALQQALQSAGYLATEEESANLLQRTGGWHALIQETFIQAQREGLGDNASLLESASRVKNAALSGNPLSGTGEAFLGWTEATPMASILVPFFKTLLGIWNAEERLSLEGVQWVKDLVRGEHSLTSEEVEALWQYLQWMGILEKNPSQEGDFYTFDPLARERLVRMQGEIPL